MTAYEKDTWTYWSLNEHENYFIQITKELSACSSTNLNWR